MEKNVGQRLAVIAIVCLIAVVLIWPPSQKLRPGLDIAGGTSLIFEIDTSKAENDPNLAERVKTLLQKRVDPKGVYDLSWRVLGQNRIEVQMPLPPRDAKERLNAYRDALEALYSHELTRGPVLRALRLPVEERDSALHQLAWQTAEEALARLSGPGAEARWAEIEQVAQTRERLLLAARDAYDVFMRAREARDRGPTESQPTSEPLASAPSSTAPTTEPVTQEDLNRAYRDASELFEDSMQEVLASNLNRRRFEEILELDAGSPVRKKSLAQIMGKHADLRDQIEEVVAKYAVWRSGKRFLESPADLRRLLRGSGRLEFRILVQPDPGNPTRYNTLRQELAAEGRTSTSDPDVAWFKVDNPMQFFNLDSPAELEAFKPEDSGHYVVGKFGSDYYVLAKTSPSEGLLQGDPSQRKWRLNRARPDRDQHGRWCVTFELDAVGGQMFEALTRRNIDKPLCILVDDVAYSAPSIRSAIRTQGEITGEFSLEKVQYLVHSMEGGTLPARLKDTPLSERTVGSTLGEANRDNAVRAGLIGACAVVLLMLVYYAVCGAVANVALAMNLFLVLAALAMLGARINLVGIAGLILSVGMGVDANVLIYERMREEKERGASLRMIIKNGYDKALSTIFDSNITTLLTCVIIYYAGSEEVKGFGLTLGWGIALNLFTSVFVTRTLFSLLVKYNLIKDIKMLKLIGVPTIDWYAKRKFFIPVSLVLMAVGLGLLIDRGSKNFLDVEFLGGVSAEFGLKSNPGAALDDVAIGKRLEKVGRAIEADARRLADATVEPVPDQVNAFVVRVPGVEAPRLAALLTEPLEEINLLQRGGITAQPGADQVTLYVQGEITPEQLAEKIHALAVPLSGAGDNLARSSVNAVLEVGGVAKAGTVWSVTTTVTNMRLVQYALETALGDEMEVKPSIEYVFRGVGNDPYPVTDQLPAAVQADLPAGVNLDLSDFLGGAAIYLDQLNPPRSTAALTERLENMHFQPDFQGMPKRRFAVFGVKPAEASDDSGNPPYSSVLVATADPDIRYSDDPRRWSASLAQPELNLVKTALSQEQTLRKVMQFKPQIAARSTLQATMALVLSWAMIIGYLWIRFGRPMYGLAGVVALIHDALIALAFVGISGWIGGRNHPIGNALLISDFKINMTIVAALLTIIGYSINDTIVVFDRIRESRGRLGRVTPEIINASINQTLSRTLLTAATTLIVLVVAYIWGGTSIRGFNFCMIVGILTGTYSSIAIAAPLLMLRITQRWGAPATAPAR
jgi:SecD/SecF fusion protein